MNFMITRPEHDDLNLHFEITLETDLKHIKQNELEPYIKDNIEKLNKIGAFYGRKVGCPVVSGSKKFFKKIL